MRASSLRIGQLARAVGIGVETVRFYERGGLLPEPPRRASGQRMYPPEAVQRLRFIRRAREPGFALSEIKELLALADDPVRGDAACVAAARREQVKRRIRDLERMRAALGYLVDAARAGDRPVHACPIIESLAGGPAVSRSKRS